MNNYITYAKAGTEILMKYEIGMTIAEADMPEATVKRHNIFKEDGYKDMLDSNPNKWVAMSVIDIKGLGKEATHAKITKYYSRKTSWLKQYSPDYDFKTYRDGEQFVLFGKRVINGI